MVNGHSVQFFDAADTLGTAVGQFVHEGIASGVHVLLIARPVSVQAVAKTFKSRRRPAFPMLIESGKLTIIDAAATLLSVMNGTRPDPDRFTRVLGSIVGRLCESCGGQPRVLSELVDILATEGNFSAVEEIEDLWDRLVEQHPLTLLCGYSAAHFTGPMGSGTLRSICGRHSQVRQAPADLLATWLLTQANAGTSV
jgi:hypothetical protein